MEILIFAIIAIGIFYKLHKQLGKIDEEEKKTIESKVSLMKKMQDEFVKKAPIKDSQAQKLIGQSSTVQELENVDQATKQNLQAIFSTCNINYEFFINGAKSAFEMVLKSFSGGDVSTLKMLLADKIFQGFQKAIDQRNVEQNKLITNLISIEKSEIISAMTLENNASIVIKFVSKQINYICDKEEKIIEGKKDEINEITDIWTFKKDLTSPNPNWIINSTSG
jgi:predicted lipid-binding transport protein (Tim44 family)